MSPPREFVTKCARSLAVVAVLVAVPVVVRPEFALAAKLWALAAVGFLSQLLQPSYRPVDRSAPVGDRGTAAQIVWTVYLTQLAGLLEAALAGWPQSVEWGARDGVFGAVIVAGLGLRTWAVAALGARFTWHVSRDAAGDGTRGLVTGGPFALMRHPGYAGAFMVFTGSLALLGAWWTLGPAAAALGLAFSRRVRLEEGYLREALPEYAGYAARVSRWGVPFPRKPPD